MPTIEDACNNNLLRPPKILLVGSYASGKSSLAFTLGAEAEVLDMDGNVRPPLSVVDQFSSARKLVEWNQLIDKDAMNPDSWETFKARVVAIHNSIISKSYKKKAVILDSFTTMGESAMRMIRKQKRKLMDPSQPTQPEWGLAFNEVQFILSMIRTWPIIVIMNCHEMVITEEDKDESGNSVTKTTRQILGIGRKLPATLGAYFSEIWYMKLVIGAGNSVAYKIQTRSNGSVVARSGLAIADMTDTKIGMKAILKSGGFDTDSISLVPAPVKPLTPLKGGE